MAWCSQVIPRYVSSINKCSGSYWRIVFDNGGDSARDLISLFITDDEWRQKPDDLFGLNTEEDTLLQTNSSQFCTGSIEFDTHHQPFATNFPDVPATGECRLETCKQSITHAGGALCQALLF